MDDVWLSLLSTVMFGTGYVRGEGGLLEGFGTGYVGRKQCGRSLGGLEVVVVDGGSSGRSLVSRGWIISTLRVYFLDGEVYWMASSGF